MRRCTSALIAVAAVLAARGVAASPGYPAALKSDLGLASAPACDLCHQSATAPVGLTDTPFGKSMVARGLLGGDDVASLAAALKKMSADHVDSDGDGAEDLDELSWGGDPNHAALPVGGAETPVLYGCAWSGGPGQGTPGWLAVLALSGAAARLGRRRRDYRR